MNWLDLGGLTHHLNGLQTCFWDLSGRHSWQSLSWCAWTAEEVRSNNENDLYSNDGSSI